MQQQPNSHGIEIHLGYVTGRELRAHVSRSCYGGNCTFCNGTRDIMSSPIQGLEATSDTVCECRCHNQPLSQRLMIGELLTGEPVPLHLERETCVFYGCRPVTE